MNAELVRSLLEKHIPFDEKEKSHLRDIISLLDAGDDAWSREHYGPGHLTASAFVVEASTRTVALIFHGKLKRWLQPGGHVENEDSDILSAARRELTEETGMNVSEDGWRLLDVDIHLIPQRSNQPEHRHFDLRFALLLNEGIRPSIIGADDAIEARWMPLQALKESGEAGLLRCFCKLEKQLFLSS